MERDLLLMEQEPFESYINRQSPEYPIRINVNGEVQEVKLTYENCIIVLHDEKYEQFDHIYIVDNSLSGNICLFRDGELVDDSIDNLAQAGYDTWFKVFPTIQDEEIWWKMQQEKLNRELDEL